MTKLKEISILGAILGLSIIGARLENNYLLYTMLGLICLFVVLVTFEKIDKRTYPYALFIIGLALLYQTMLMSNGLIGSDIHTEYHYCWLVENQGWDSSIAHAYNSCLGTVILTPFLAKVLHVDGIWIYKVIYPLLFALVPVLLFLIFKKQFEDKIAFLSVFFFLAVPVWSLELIQVPRQMLGELMLAACAYLIVVSNWRMRIRIPLLGLCAVLGATFHYVMGPAIFLYLCVSMVILPFFKGRNFPVKWLVVVISIFIIISIGWYSSVASGISYKFLSAAADRQINKVEKIIDNLISPPPEVKPKKVEPKEVEPKKVEPKKEVTPKKVTPSPTPGEQGENIIEQGAPLVQTAFGIGFADASTLGKMFWILQFMTQFFLVIGCVYLFIKKKKYNPEYLALATGGAILILLSIFLPSTLALINITRVYHLALLFLSPALVLGGLLIFRNPKILTICILIPYFLFTSGIMFEAFKHEDVSKADVPYSIALSHERVDVAAVFTDNDMAVRDWAVENKCEPMFLDVNGRLLFSEQTIPSSWRHIRLIDISTMEDGYALLPEDKSKLPDNYYIFLREWNIQNEKVTFHPFGRSGAPAISAGMRKSWHFSEMGLEETLATSKIVYRMGDAIIYKNN